MKGVSDEGGGGASDHLSGGLGRNRPSGGAGDRDAAGRELSTGTVPSTPERTQHAPSPHLLEDLLQRGHGLLLAGSRLERGRGVRQGTAPPQKYCSLPTTPERTYALHSLGLAAPRPCQSPLCHAILPGGRLLDAGVPLEGRERDRKGGMQGGRERDGKGGFPRGSSLELTSACSASWYRWGGKGRVIVAVRSRGGPAKGVSPPCRAPPCPAAPRVCVPPFPGTCSTLLCTTVPMALEQRRGVRPLKSPALPSTFTMCLAGDSGGPVTPRGGPPLHPHRPRGARGGPGGGGGGRTEQTHRKRRGRAAGRPGARRCSSPGWAAAARTPPAAGTGSLAAGTGTGPGPPRAPRLPAPTPYLHQHLHVHEGLREHGQPRAQQHLRARVRHAAARRHGPEGHRHHHRRRRRFRFRPPPGTSGAPAERFRPEGPPPPPGRRGNERGASPWRRGLRRHHGNAACEAGEACGLPAAYPRPAGLRRRHGNGACEACGLPAACRPEVTPWRRGLR